MAKDIAHGLEESITKLVKVVSKLRDPDQGCPWDKEQTHQSLIPYVLEEAYEVVDAIREENYKNLIEELGDLLLQVILHAQIASEENQFSLLDIIQGITEKLIRRHPHVFNKKKVLNIKEVQSNWEEIKSSEKSLSSSITPISDDLKDKTRSQPSINATMKICQKVSKLGLELEKIEDLWEKLDEELKEFKEGLNTEYRNNANEELGDVLFTMLNISRWYKINPEESLNNSNKKFLKRFSSIESRSKSEFTSKSRNEIQVLWNYAKQNEKNSNN